MFENTTPSPASNQPSPFGAPFNPTPAPGLPPLPPTPEQPMPDGMNQDVHTMPERFFAAADSGHGGGRKGGRTKILIIVAAAVLVLGAGGYLAYSQLLASKSNDNTNIANAPLNLNTNRNTNVNRTTNTTIVTNANNNANSNGNLNANLNANTNATVNTNTVLNTNTVINTNTSSNTNTSVSAVPLPLSKDTDGDGLSDEEEKTFATNVSTPDTDGDGFIDGKQLNANGQTVGEVYLGYDPTQVGATLASNTRLVTSYTNSTQRYKTLYPAKWTGRASDSVEAAFVITPDQATGEYFTINVEANPQKLSAEQWYRNVNPSATTVTALTVNGLEGVRSSDDRTVYLAKNDKVYILGYNPGTVTELHYRTFFDVLVNNFALVAGSATNNTNAAATNGS